MSINEMESKARELRELQALIDEATAEAEALKDALKAAMGDAEEVRAGCYGDLRHADLVGRRVPLQGGSSRRSRSRPLFDVGVALVVQHL